MNAFELNLTNIDVSKDFMIYIEHQVEKILASCPISSHIRLTLEGQGKNKVHGEIKVSSPSSEIVFAGDNSSLATVVMNIFEEVEIRIRRWRLLRFSKQTVA